MPFEWLKLLHVGSALLSISGFGLRGYWMLTGDPRLRFRPARLLPHILDTVLLASAIGMLVMLRANPFAFPWLTAKIAALLCYIGLGMVAFRFGKSRRVRVTAFGMALLTAAYIVAVAVTKSPLGLPVAWPGSPGL
jgi:uncharacterized membrane protein SirB2